LQHAEVSSTAGGADRVLLALPWMPRTKAAA